MEHCQVIVILLLLKSTFEQDLGDGTYEQIVSRTVSVNNLILHEFCERHSAIRQHTEDKLL